MSVPFCPYHFVPYHFVIELRQVIIAINAMQSNGAPALIRRLAAIQIVVLRELRVKLFRLAHNTCINIYALPRIYCNIAILRRGWRIGRVDAFRPNGHGFDSRSIRHVGTLYRSFTHSCLWRFGVKLRYSIRAVSGAPLRSRGLEAVL